jgi:hypothetical protein
VVELLDVFEEIQGGTYRIIRIENRFGETGVIVSCKTAHDSRSIDNFSEILGVP